MTNQRDDRQNALEDVSKNMSEAQRQQAAAEIRLSEVQGTSRIEHQRVRQEMLARISDIRTSWSPLDLDLECDLKYIY